MLILLPILLIILTIFVIDSLYFEDTKPKEIQQNQVIKKDANVSSQKYLDKYLKK